MFVLLVVVGSACQGQATNPATAAHPTPTAATLTPTKESPAADASPTPVSPGGWPTYVNTAGGYSLSYPPTWYQIPNPNTPNDYPASFSNENAGYWPRSTPEVGTPNNVFLTVGRDAGSGSCGSPQSVISSSAVLLGGVPASRYIVNLPPGLGDPDPNYRIVVSAAYKGDCWSLTFDSRTISARDGNAPIDDQIIGSFRFLA